MPFKQYNLSQRHASRKVFIATVTITGCIPLTATLMLGNSQDAYKIW